jgi:Protein of unknown function (DUF4058)
MPSPFPGMDPYLEDPDLWRDVHGNLVVAIQGALAAQVAPTYYVAIEEHTYIVALDAPRALIRPDTAIIRDPASAPPAGGLAVATRAAVTPRIVTLPQFEELREPYLELRRTATHEVVTVVELLSPTNKSAGKGRDEYVEKRRRLLQTPTSLVEIDLLRAGEPMEVTPRPTEEYRVLVARPWERPAAQLWAFNVRDLLPEVPAPLRRGEPEAVIPLGKLLAEAYDRARYDLRLDYRQPPPAPPLTAEDAAWAASLITVLAAAGQTEGDPRKGIDEAAVPDESKGASPSR